MSHSAFIEEVKVELRENMKEEKAENQNEVNLLEKQEVEEKVEEGTFEK